MAHPFAAPGGAAEITAGRRRWWGSCAWDGLGLVAALELDDAAVTSNGVTLRVHEGELLDDAWFHVAVPTARWWEDIAHT
jgi:Alkylmercury lyase